MAHGSWFVSEGGSVGLRQVSLEQLRQRILVLGVISV